MSAPNYFLVTWVRIRNGLVHQETKKKLVPDQFTDHFQVFAHLPDAQKNYNELCELETTWSANVSRVIRSTDYNLPTHMWNNETKPKKRKLFKDRGIKSPNERLAV